MSRLVLFALLVLLPACGTAPEPSAVSLPGRVEPLAGEEPPPAPKTVTPWQEWVNRYRASALLPPLTENGNWSDGNVQHGHYGTYNNILDHQEDSAKPCYSAAGASAGSNSDIAASGSSTAADTYMIDLWMRAPFHAVGILDPRLKSTGYGAYHEGAGPPCGSNEVNGGLQTAAGLDVLRGRSGSIPAEVQYPILWPGRDKAVPLTTLASEWPNPLTSCAGYTAPVGLPLVVQMASAPTITASALSTGGVALQHCVFTGQTYTNPTTADQNLARNVLSARNALVLIPRAPLITGNTYRVVLTVNNQVLDWSFTSGNFDTTAPGCTYTVVPTSQSVSAPATVASLAVTATAGCAWTVSSPVPWAAVAPTSGSGTGTVTVTMAANTGAVRSTTLTVAGQPVALTQAAGTTAPAGQFTDDFSRPDGEVGNGWTVARGSWKVVSNTARTSGPAQHLLIAPISGAAQTVNAWFTSTDNNNGPRFGFVVRSQDALNYYALVRQTGGSSQLRIIRVENGAEKVLATANLPNPAKNAAFQLNASVNGSTLTLNLGSTVVTTTDATWATGGIGVLIGVPAGTASHILDTFAATIQ